MNLAAMIAALPEQTPAAIVTCWWNAQGEFDDCGFDFMVDDLEDAQVAFDPEAVWQAYQDVKATVSDPEVDYAPGDDFDCDFAPEADVANEYMNRPGRWD